MILPTERGSHGRDRGLSTKSDPVASAFRRKLQLAALAAALACLSSSVPPQAQAAKPNILLIQADDLGYGDLSVYGQAMFQTPSIDRLARNGLRFIRYYAGST